MKKRNLVGAAVMALLALSAQAQEEASALDQLTVRGKKTNDILPTFPSTAVSADAETIADTVNAVDTPDALKYFPGIFVRKRDSADYNGAPVGSRIWGNNYSAKHTVTVDGVPITNQIFQNNSYGSPKWWVTSPDEIRTVEVMYGPFSAAYSGNATGAVVNIATQMPEKFEASVNTTLATTHFQKFGTSDTNHTGALNLMLGNKAEGLSWRLSLNHEDAMTQPRSWITSNKLNVTGYEYHSKNYATNGSYVGAGGIVHGLSDSLNLKLSYDLAPDLKLGVLTGVWQGNSDAGVQSYLSGPNAYKNFTNNATYGTVSWQSSTTSNAYLLDQLHLINAITLKTRADQVFSWELAASSFRYQNDKQRWAKSLNADGSMSDTTEGSLADYSGTGWTNLDFRGNYRWNEANTLSFGVHQDHNNYQYLLTTDTASSIRWRTGEQLATDNTIAKGETQTQALWLQNMWKAHEKATLTAGLRAEYWKAFGGYNYASSTAFVQPEKNAHGLSPKLSLMLDGPNDWLTIASVAQTVRFASLNELYSVAKCSDTISPAQACETAGVLDTSNISTGNYAVLKPEKVTSAELSFEKNDSAGHFRATVFGEVTRDAILAQYGVLNPAHPQGLYSYSLNVEKVHAYGLELAGLWRNVGLDGLDLNGQVTRIWSAIDESSSKGSLGQNIVGNPLTYVSPWRAMAMATYRPNEKWTYNISGRYQKAGASGVDNNDYFRSTYGGFDSFFVVDTKVRYKFDKQWTASAGIDNLLNRDYWIFHPFPQRTFVANLKYVH
jgi:iron complex outermembrane receptor protein